MEILITLLLQIVLTLGVIVIFGLIIGGCKYILIKNMGVKIYKATAIVGTPIHELGHMLMCLLFGHKIVAVKLLDLKGNDGTLGYVKHSYNKKNIYHRIGNFFIGIGPIILGTFLLTLLLFIMCPISWNDFILNLNSIDMSDSLSITGSIINCIWNLIINIFTFKDGFLCALYLFIGLLISAHMSLSASDIKGGLDGVIFILLIYIILDLIIFFCGKIQIIKQIFVTIGAYLILLLAIALIFCIAQLLISILIKIFRRKK